MSAGTLTLTNNSAAVAGSGTAFTTELAAGDFIVVTVGGIPYTLPVKTINSNTSLTLVSNFTGPTQSGSAWSAVPRVALNMVTAALVAQSAEALRGLNYDKQNWQSIFSGTGNVTVKLPDGSTWTGPAWNGIASTLSGKMDKSQNLNDVNDKAKSRQNLGLGSCATKDAGEANGNVMIRGDSSRQTTTGIAAAFRRMGLIGSGWFRDDGSAFDGTGAGIYRYGQIFFSKASDTYAALCVSTTGLVSAVGTNQTQLDAGNVSINQLYGTANTTKASDGTLKASSPIVKLYSDGRAETNEESQGITVIRQEVGEYLIEGCMGLNSDAAWGGIDGGFDIPKDRNRQPLIWLDYKVNPNGSVLVKTYHRTHPAAPAFARNERDGFSNGDPIDIPSDQYVSVRVEMPSDSLWNQRQEEAREAMEKAESECEKNQQDTQS
ncbi:phage tail protein [Citrobacter braakii]|uniref:Phage tail protein n=1 Tax=Citrobacter braakii TaxID=57706 RepID=A0A1V8P2P8_CITBR|nr:phage tail protein [Citrobacter braakii]MEB0939353.1 phage tail protein [Citrobacter braakii]MEB0944565.1 phage tail protein [Citrobacter braakii]MEB0969371.1 phage tail protein [Citrobacter braakii]MEB0993769.1 phage tail protein [Citrobacter braakii]MEB1009286.1 phage tail protein [Citrobacter braakii]